MPLVDLDEHTGATAIWEGSHRAAGSRQHLQNLRDQSTLAGATIPTPKRGDVYLMDLRVIHAGTANTSLLARPILYIVYTRPWFQEDANFPEQRPLDISKKRYRKLSKTQQSLFARAWPS